MYINRRCWIPFKIYCGFPRRATFERAGEDRHVILWLLMHCGKGCSKCRSAPRTVSSFGKSMMLLSALVLFQCQGNRTRHVSHEKSLVSSFDSISHLVIYDKTYRNLHFPMFSFPFRVTCIMQRLLAPLPNDGKCKRWRWNVNRIFFWARPQSLNLHENNTNNNMSDNLHETLTNMQV